MIYCIDLFCGAGGTTTGVERARLLKRKIAKVIYCINHDPNAIESHKSNHPRTKHAVEDIRTHELTKLRRIVEKIRAKDPNAIILLWASLECTNFSKAKGGLSRDADSRSLAHHMYRYIEAINPDMFWVENVEEFIKWGPLRWKHKPVNEELYELLYDKKQKPVFEPIKESYAEFYTPWVEDIKAYGYNYEYRLLNSADFGAYTSRKRLFIQFNKPHIPIVWPMPTHAKNPKGDLFSKPLKKWKAVKKVLDLNDPGKSIFDRSEPLVEATLERIYAGLLKFVANGDTSFLTKYLSNNPKTGINAGADLNNPSPTITTQSRLYVTSAEFLIQRNSGNPESKVVDVEGPARTLTSTGGNQMPVFIKTYHGNGNNVHSLNNPCPTVPAADTHGVVFIDRQYSNGTPVQSVDCPAASLTTVPKLNVVKVEPFIVDGQYNNNGSSIDKPLRTITADRRHFYLLNPQWFNKGASSVENPCFTLIARMDKTPPYIVATEHGYAAIEIYETDSPAMVKIKQFMAAYGIIDIKMRMLNIPELLRIQGFGDKYKLVGSQEQQKKYIGNSVVPEVVRAMIEATIMELYATGYLKAAA
jgi:DNA (cytosine-5)-methyltransferase 1